MKSLMITKYGDIDSSLEKQEVPKPIIEANQILIKTYSSSFNPYDYKIVRGDFNIQLAKHLGAKVTTTTSTKNISFVKSLGADKVIDYTSQNYLDEGAVFDVVYDTLGSNYTLDSFKVLKNGGRVVSIAGTVDSITAEQFGLNRFIRMILSFQARKVTKTAAKMNAMYRFLFMSPNGDQLEELAKLYESGSIKPLIDKVYNFDEGVQALEYLAKGRAKGKVIVKIREDI